jgi:hypothetical protein
VLDDGVLAPDRFVHNLQYSSSKRRANVTVERIGDLLKYELRSQLAGHPIDNEVTQ